MENFASIMMILKENIESDETYKKNIDVILYTFNIIYINALMYYADYAFKINPFKDENIYGNFFTGYCSSENDNSFGNDNLLIYNYYYNGNEFRFIINDGRILSSNDIDFFEKFGITIEPYNIDDNNGIDEYKICIPVKVLEMKASDFKEFFNKKNVKKYVMKKGLES